MTRFFCTKCSTRLQASDLQCPNCGSYDRFIDSSPVFPLDKLTLGLIDKNIYSGKHKYAYEISIKPSYDLDTQQDVVVSRRFNRTQKNKSNEKTYLEEIMARDGKILKSNNDVLTKHKGHGSDKKDK